ncbi:MAG: amidohydrolase family protein [Actinomycetota bacterium]
MTIRTPFPAIDVHTHLFPERLANAVRRALTRMYGWSFDLPTDPIEFSDFVRQRGTERFCMLPYAHKAGMARSLNEWMANTARTLPGAIGFACINQDDDEKESILTDAFDAGLHGIKLHYQVQNVAPNDERLYPVYELMLDLDLPLVVHAGKGPTDNGLVGAERFRLLMERYPALRVCVAHLGAPEREAFIVMANEFPALYLDTSGMGNRSFAGLGLEDIADRVLFGSDAPNIGFDYGLTIERILDLELGDDIERKIFRDNAKAFLKLD